MSMKSVINVEVTSSENDEAKSPTPEGDWICVKNKYDKNQDFNQGNGGLFVWVWYQTKDVILGDTRESVSALRFLTGNDAIIAPVGWIKCGINFNNKDDKEAIYLFYKKTAGFDCIEKLVAGYGNSTQSAMDDFDKSAIVLRQDTNRVAGGDSKFIFLGYELNAGYIT